MNTELLNVTWGDMTKKKRIVSEAWDAYVTGYRSVPYTDTVLGVPYTEHREECFTINTSMDEINRYRRSAIDFVEYTKGRIIERCVLCRLLISQISVDWQFGIARINVTGQFQAAMNETALRIYNIDKLRNFQII